MLTPPHTKRSFIRTPKRVIVTMSLTVSAVLLASCGSSNSSAAGVDTSEAGQLAYACALKEHVEADHGAPDSWDDFIGDDADPAVRETAAIGALAMGSDDETFSDPGEILIEGISRADIETLSSGLEHMEQACAGIEGTEQAAVSHEAQLDYACSLADHISAEHGEAATWLNDDDFTVLSEAMGAAALTGAMNGQTLAGHQELSEAGRDLLTGVSRADADYTDEFLEAFQSACAQL
ncbi:MAG TPA: hypothetical protein H9884_09750 [Candidatus Yaniella excrementigallinarum]|nr:hypothetical protein [Candidatus Yaniella excrementigallinarum]